MAKKRTDTKPKRKPKATPPGDWQAWDAQWPAIAAGEHKLLYTKGEPTSDAQTNLRAYWDELWDRLEGDTRGQFVELGAGRGTTSQYLAAQGADVTLVDLAESGLAVACENFAATNLDPPTCVKSDAAKTGLESDAFACVHSVGVLEHFDDPTPILRESLRLVADDGVIFHVIIAGQDGPGMKRTAYDASQYAQWARESGAGYASVVNGHIPGVLLLTMRRSASPNWSRWCAEKGAAANAKAPQSVPLKIAIVGTAPSSMMAAPFNDPTWEIWSLSTVPERLPRITRWFELHSLHRKKATRPEYYDWMCKTDVPVYLDEPDPAIRTGIPYPRDKVFRRFDSQYFASTVDYMIALAVMEIERNGGNGQIGIWGVDMAQAMPGDDSEYAFQRPSLEYWIGRCTGVGAKPCIPVWVPPESPILKLHRPYGFDTYTKATKRVLQSRMRELEQRRGEALRARDDARQRMHEAMGAFKQFDALIATKPPEPFHTILKERAAERKQAAATHQHKWREASNICEQLGGVLSTYPWLMQGAV